MVPVLRIRRLHALLGLAAVMPGMAVAAVAMHGSAPAASSAAAGQAGGLIQVISHPPGAYVLFDTVLGRTMVVPDPKATQPQAGAGPSPTASPSAGGGQGADQPGPASPNSA